MSDAGDLAAATVALHEERAHGELHGQLQDILNILDRLCADGESARAALEAHLAAYHAPEPAAEEPPLELVDETTEAAEEPIEHVVEEPAAEPEAAPEPDRAPENPHFYFRRLRRE
jgi:hypothetical protein